MTTQWISDLDRRGIYELEAYGIEWLAIEAWLDTLNPLEANAARRLVKGVLDALADPATPPRTRDAAYNELYRRLIASGIVD